ncbi:MAG: right-handed parallel beta-helix repeat-containing protein [bacterium]
MRAREPALTVSEGAPRWVGALVALLALASPGCGDGSGGQNSSACPEGFESQGPACVPIFDNCPGPAELAVLGGGCRAVGVTACATGLFEPDGEGGCEPILPAGSDPCPPGTMEVLGQTECQPVGVTECVAGFESDGEGGCNAILPVGPDPCPPGTIALLGHTECQPLGDCGASGPGTSPWGNIIDDGTTVYVDQTADATGADGTAQAPFVTIGEALAVVLPGGQIAVAAGDYTERLNVHQPLRLTGRCAELVTIRGQWWLGDVHAPVTIAAGGAGTTVRGVTLTGPGEGIVLSGAQQVVLSQLQVVDASEIGIFAEGGAEVSLQQVVVAGCAYLGVASRGSTLSVEQSVVRSTRPQSGTGRFGRGIHAECSSSGACGSLRVSSCLVSGNREAGIIAIGTDLDVIASVVRDTLPEELTEAAGRGIEGQCNPAVGPCGSLRVSSCLVSGNRELGIAGSGMDTEITGTVVRDTLAEQSTGKYGRGIEAQCLPTEICGSLRVSSCLVSGNREVGITVSGMDAEITGTVVRDTMAEESTEWFGQGIGAQCLSGGACGSLRVSSCLVSGNRELGIAVSGVDTEITDTVVRDTMSAESNGESGRGINAQCDPQAGACGSLRVTSCLVSGNRAVGIDVIGVDAEVTATVVRDTLSEESTGVFGRGINAECHPAAGSCGSLGVSSCLVSGNRGLGICVSGVDTEVTGTVVRDTQPEESTGKFGRGIEARCYPEVGICGSLRVSSCLLAGNREVGIVAGGVDAEVTGTVVRDTLPEQSTGGFGRGINAQCDPSVAVCGSLRVSSSLVMSSENVGIFIAGVSATLEGVAVIDTWPNAQGPLQGIHGQGLWALCHPETGACGGLSMTSCLVDSSQGAGVAVEGVSGFMASSVVRSVVPQSLDGRYGYGVQIGGLEGQQGQEMPAFNVNDCEIRDARLAGILYYRSRGTLARSVVSGGENSVLMNEGSEPTILDNNELSGTIMDEPAWANVYPSPAPAPALPLEPGQ